MAPLGQCNQYLMNSNLAVPERLHGAKSPVTLRTVTADEAGQRIDNFLMRHFKTVPRSRVYRLLRKGEVRINRKRVDAEYRIQAGDEVRLFLGRDREKVDQGQAHGLASVRSTADKLVRDESMPEASTSIIDAGARGCRRRPAPPRSRPG